ncbi:hypothetical protein KSP40_PGU001344 [Platanthera guangdongensis]|uniref:Uncharacterized protein n=1 Tax=Platanthera guangdongensis TaxID=2320717 RepID=A0ABR2MY15_9ASPA
MVQFYERHVFLCYKTPHVWLSHVEVVEFDRLPRLFSVALDARIGEMMKRVDGFLQLQTTSHLSFLKTSTKTGRRELLRTHARSALSEPFARDTTRPSSAYTTGEHHPKSSDLTTLSVRSPGGKTISRRAQQSCEVSSPLPARSNYSEELPSHCRQGQVTGELSFASWRAGCRRDPLP